MPEEFQKIITIEMPLRVRQKPNGTYEARFRMCGYSITASSADYKKLKAKFIEALKRYKPKTEPSEPVKNVLLFSDIAERWLQLKKPTIKANTFKFYTELFGTNILPAFLATDIRDIKQSDVQSLINKYIDQGKMRTATKIYQTLKALFDFAIGDELIEKSPMRMLRPPKYEEKNGTALTRQEEKDFIEKLKKSQCSEEVRQALIFLLYTGLRRSELASARVDGGFITVRSSKIRKGLQEKERAIPITPMLAKWLPAIDLEAIRKVRPDALTQAVKRLTPAHHLHELRHTFITRCQECGVPREVVSVWAGHAADGTMTSNVYTHFSAEFMLKEGQKVVYGL